MAARKCPQCLATVAAGCVVAFSNDIECPGCKRRLEVSSGSRYLATLAGLGAAALVWQMTRASGGMFGWALPVVYAFLAFSVVSPLVLILIADLRNKPEESVAEPEHPATGHGLVQLGHGGPHS